MSNIDTSVVNLAEVYGFLIIQWLIMMLLWAYLEQVVPSGWGVKKHPLFFLKYFGLLKKTEKKKQAQEMQFIEKDSATQVDDMVSKYMEDIYIYIRIYLSLSSFFHHCLSLLISSSFFLLLFLLCYCLFLE